MIGQLIGGRYHITGKLGSGGFCQTYVAKDSQKFNNPCVVKKLKPLCTLPETFAIASELFEREAQTQYRLGNHNQIPQLLAYFQENHEFYLVQELIEGHSLCEELPPGKQLSESEVIPMLQNVLEPLAFVHQQQVIHRDIKPPNLIRRYSDNKIVLIDFGAVKELAATEVLNPQGETKIITTIGTPGYMPSEQTTGKARFSSDVYAVGIIGIQALTGKMAQELEEHPETAEIIWRNDVKVNPKLAKILERMVRYDFRERYRSAVEALEAIQKLNNRKALSLPLKLPSTPEVSNPQPVKSPVSWLSTVKQKLKSPWLLPLSTAAIVFSLGGWYLHWQLPINMTIETVRESKEEGNYAKCISLSQAFSSDSHLATRLKTLLQDCQNLQAQSYLTAARQLAKEEKYDRALVKLKQISPGKSAYAEAQQLLVEWDLTSYEFYNDYQQAIDYINKLDYPQALDSLYLAADRAIAVERANLLLSEIIKNERGIFEQFARETDEWEFLKDSLIRANPDDYQLTYQRAKLELQGDRNRHHAREFELLFSAANKAIDNQQTEIMLAQLREDRKSRFRNLSFGHTEWNNLFKALEQKNKQFLQ